jgi:enoyl-CoA hydratase
VVIPQQVGELPVQTRREDAVGWITLNRPAKRNAINHGMRTGLDESLASMAGDDEVRVVVLTGAGPAFCAGVDLSERAPAARHPMAAAALPVAHALAAFGKPLIAAINGPAVGGGLELALACDLRVASRASKLGLPETSLGIYPAAGGTWRLPRLVGLGRAKELVFTGRILDADEAYALGLLERVCEPGEAVAQALALAGQIAQNAPLALRVAKLSLNAAARGADPGTLERLGQALLFDSPDKYQRMTAFLEKRSRKKE